MADDPSLRCRLRGAHDVWRVIVDGSGRTPATAQVLTDRWADTTVMVTTPRCSDRTRAAWARNSSRVWVLPAGANGRIGMASLLRRLAGEGIMHVLCEGGSRMAGAFIRANLVDEYVLFYAPAIMGDARAIGAVAGADFRLANMPRLHIEEVACIGKDLMVRARPV